MLTRCDRRPDHGLTSVVAVTLLTSAALACAATEDTPDETETPMRPVIGWAENVRLMDLGIEQQARVDTGAGLGSIDAAIIAILKSDAPLRPDRVVFSIENGKGGTATLEKDIVEWVNIKNKGANGSTRRPVVIMTICLAGTTIAGRMNLAARGNFRYPILIGRNLLQTGRFLVDSEHTFTHEPRCEP